jgi:hypothetical protein
VVWATFDLSFGETLLEKPREIRYLLQPDEPGASPTSPLNLPKEF